MQCIQVSVTLPQSRGGGAARGIVQAGRCIWDPPGKFPRPQTHLAYPDLPLSPSWLDQLCNRITLSSFDTGLMHAGMVEAMVYQLLSSDRS